MNQNKPEIDLIDHENHIVKGDLTVFLEQMKAKETKQHSLADIKYNFKELENQF